MRKLTVFIGGLTVILGLVQSAAAAYPYKLTPLSTSNGWALGINASGQVVGRVEDEQGFGHAFLYRNGTMTDLGLGWAYDINDSGQVVGTNRGGRAFVYCNGTMTDLGTFGGAYADPRAINNSGQIAGDYTTAPVTPLRAFLYSQGDVTYLETLLGNVQGSTVCDINDAGQVAGSYWVTDYVHGGVCYHGFLYTDGVITDLGADTWTEAINDCGQVVGARVSGPHFLYSNGTMTDLDGLVPDWDRQVLAIDNHGQMVGRGTPPDDTDAFLYSNGTLTYLKDLIDPALGWTLEDAQDINDSGWIVGSGSDPMGEYHPILLTPIPEPSTLALLATGLAGLLCMVWRGRNRTT